MVSTSDLNSSFLATKSVSEFTSTITAFSSFAITFAKPSAAIRDAFLAALLMPFSLSQVIASSMLPFVSSKAFLQSNIPAPVVSLNSFTILAVIIVILPYSNYYLF